MFTDVFFWLQVCISFLGYVDSVLNFVLFTFQFLLTGK